MQFLQLVLMHGEDEGDVGAAFLLGKQPIFACRFANVQPMGK
jgi:hypothetical protein